jgi:hypothetical protein
MKRARIPQALLPALLASVAVWAAPAPNQSAATAPVAVRGAYAVTFNVEPGAAAQAGGAITCKAKITPKLAPFESRGAVPVESAAGVATVTGTTTACLVVIPFAWTVNGRGNGVTLSYELRYQPSYKIDDASSSGPVAAARTQQGIVMAYPEMEKTASVRLKVIF